MRRRRNDNLDDVGSDSFLDIVSNVVGILIILVMVVGAKVKNAPLDPSTVDALTESSSSLLPSSRASLDETREARNSLAADVLEKRSEIADLQTTIELEKSRRLELNTQLMQIEKAMNERSNLSDNDRRLYDLGRDIAATKMRLEDIEQNKLSAVSQPGPQITLESTTTPISKTVFRTEQHYRLRDGRLTRIPFHELKDVLFADKRQIIWKLRDLPEVSGTVGPIDHFRLQYHLRKTNNGGKLTQAIFLPTRSNLGVPLEEALRRGSEFQRELEKIDPRDITITVWIFPESFTKFRLLRSQLHDLGFTVAGRPMDKDDMIGFSPSGTRSAAE